MDKQIETKIRFSLNRFLMYTIQDVTGKPSVDILAFFHDLSRSIANIGLEKNKGKGIRKDLEDFFPGTSVPFKMLIKGHKSWHRGTWNPHTRQYEGEEKDVFDVSVEIGFPDNSLGIPEAQMKNISEALAERELLGGDGITLPAFEKPETKTPKMYKSMMEEICGKGTTRKRVEGYDPEPITQNCRNCGGLPKEHLNATSSHYKCSCDEYWARKKNKQP